MQLSFVVVAVFSCLFVVKGYITILTVQGIVFVACQNTMLLSGCGKDIFVCFVFFVLFFFTDN